MTSIQQTEELTGLAGASGKILAISYPILAVSTGSRAFYQLAKFLFTGEIDNLLGTTLSAVAAICYILATVGFAKRAKWAWWLSVSVLGIETLCTVVVGTISIINPDLFGGTVWRYFGIDYGFFPFIQPIIGLIWLCHPTIRRVYQLGF